MKFKFRDWCRGTERRVKRFLWTWCSDLEVLFGQGFMCREGATRCRMDAFLFTGVIRDKLRHLAKLKTGDRVVIDSVVYGRCCATFLYVHPFRNAFRVYAVIPKPVGMGEVEEYLLDQVVLPVSDRGMVFEIDMTK